MVDVCHNLKMINFLMMTSFNIQCYQRFILRRLLVTLQYLHHNKCVYTENIFIDRLKNFLVLSVQLYYCEYQMNKQFFPPLVGNKVVISIPDGFPALMMMVTKEVRIFLADLLVIF